MTSKRLEETKPGQTGGNVEKLTHDPGVVCRYCKIKEREGIGPL